MAGKENPCRDGLTPECFKRYPKYAKKVFAYKLMQAVLQSPLSADLQKILWHHLTQVPISWMDWEDFIIPDDIPLEEIISEDWTSEDPLPDELTINLNELIPDDWVEGDPLPDGVTIDPGTVIPDDWKVGDEIPAGVTINVSELFPDDWTISDPLPEGIVINIDVVLPKVWTVGEDLPFGITVDPDFKLETAMLETLGVYVEPGKTYEEVFGAGWDPTKELPSGASWEPYVEDIIIKESAVPPLYIGIGEPGPVHSVSSTPPAEPVTVTVYSGLGDGYVQLEAVGWEAAHDAVVGDWCGLASKWGGSAMISQLLNGDAWISRSFFDFDLSDIPAGKECVSVSLFLMQYDYHDSSVGIQAGTQADPATVDDYASFLPTVFASQVFVAGLNEFILNAAGLAFIQSKFGLTAKLFAREAVYDISGDTPASGTHLWNGICFANNTTEANRPRLQVTYK